MPKHVFACYHRIGGKPRFRDLGDIDCFLYHPCFKIIPKNQREKVVSVILRNLYENGVVVYCLDEPCEKCQQSPGTTLHKGQYFCDSCLNIVLTEGKSQEFFVR